MKQVGKARKAAVKLIFISLLAVLAVWAIGAFTVAAAAVSAAMALAITPFLVVLWIVFALFTFYFFRDPEARVPVGPGLIVSPAHGKVDVVDTTTQPQFMGGECQRVLMFLSAIDRHGQNAPARWHV